MSIYNIYYILLGGICQLYIFKPVVGLLLPQMGVGMCANAIMRYRASMKVLIAIFMVLLEGVIGACPSICKLLNLLVKCKLLNLLLYVVH